VLWHTVGMRPPPANRRARPGVVGQVTFWPSYSEHSSWTINQYLPLASVLLASSFQGPSGHLVNHGPVGQVTLETAHEPLADAEPCPTVCRWAQAEWFLWVVAPRQSPKPLRHPCRLPCWPGPCSLPNVPRGTFGANGQDRSAPNFGVANPSRPCQPGSGHCKREVGHGKLMPRIRT
jgi:hypothetical protein